MKLSQKQNENKLSSPANDSYDGGDNGGGGVLNSTTTTTTTTNTTNDNNIIDSSGQKKKRKKRLTKSQRKKRKRERLLQEEKERQQQLEEGKNINEKVKHSKDNNSEDENHNNNKKKKKEKKKNQKQNDKVDPLIQQIKTSHDDDNDNNNATKKENEINSKESYNQQHSRIDTTNLIEFVYPKQKSNNNHKDQSSVIKSYMHAKLRRQYQSHNDYNHHGSDVEADGHNMTNRQRALSMDVANESIDDIFSSLDNNQKKKNKNENKVERKCNGEKERKIEQSKTKSLSIVNENNREEESVDINKKTDDGSSTSISNSSEEEENGVQLFLQDHSDNDEKEKEDDSSSDSDSKSSQSLASESNENKKIRSSPILDNPEGREKVKANVSVEAAEIDGHYDDRNETNTMAIDKPTTYMISREIKKRSMSEDSTHDSNANSQLSGISIEMAMKDKIGRRPRSNSTDGELNLPRRGLCDEQKVMSFHRWDMEKFHPCPPRVKVVHACY
jgi:hypothetical protein